MSASVFGSGISARTVGSRKLATSATSTPRPARMRASNSGTSSWRWAIASARACPRSSRRSRQARPQTERSTPRKSRRVWPVGVATAIVMSLHCESLFEKLPILDEARALRHLVVERAGIGIGLVGQPVDPARASRARPLLDRRDQRAAEPQIARAFSHEQVLQIAVVADGPARAVKEIVHDT